jgi:hypothetical protein
MGSSVETELCQQSLEANVKFDPLVAIASRIRPVVQEASDLWPPGEAVAHQGSAQGNE